jgi:hypothetical protein
MRGRGIRLDYQACVDWPDQLAEQRLASERNDVWPPVKRRLVAVVLEHPPVAVLDERNGIRWIVDPLRARGRCSRLRGHTPEHYVLRADLPGLSDEDVSVQFEDNVLTIFGERKAERETQQEGYYRIERSSGGFSRSLTLPEGIDPDGVQAHFDRGVLEIRIPKPEQTKPRQVQISLGTRPMHRDTIASAETGQP